MDDLKKKRNFSTREICDIFGVGRETLRHYEELGLLNPDIINNNGYREYDYWDIGAMIDILKYKSFGLTLKQAKESMYKYDFDQLLMQAKTQEEAYELKLIQDQIVLEMIKNNKRMLEFAKDNMGNLTETDIPSLIHIPFEMNKDGTYYEATKEALTFSRYFTTSIVFHAIPGSEFEGIGLMAPLKYAKYFDIKESIVAPSTRVVGTVLDIVGKELITPDHFAEFEKKVYQKYDKVSNMTYATLIARFYDKNKEYHQYLTVYKGLPEYT